MDINVKDATLGDKTQASVQVLNLLGEKYLELTPKGSGEMEAGDTVPVSRTNGSYDIVATLGELTTTTEAINIPRLSKALTTLGDTVNARQPAHQVDVHRPLRHLPLHRHPGRVDPAAARPRRARHQAALASAGATSSR